MGWKIADHDAPYQFAVTRRAGYLGLNIRQIDGPPRLKIFSEFAGDQVTPLRQYQEIDTAIVQEKYPEAFHLYDE